MNTSVSTFRRVKWGSPAQGALSFRSRWQQRLRALLSPGDVVRTARRLDRSTSAPADSAADYTCNDWAQAPGSQSGLGLRRESGRDFNPTAACDHEGEQGHGYARARLPYDYARIGSRSVHQSLELHSVTVERGRARLLSDVSLCFGVGQVHAVVGANGAGKSSLLGVLSGDLPPDFGWVRWNGRRLDQWCMRRLACERAMVIQDTVAATGLRTEELVALGRLPHGACRRDRARILRAMQAADALELWGREVSTLSGGERQRVQIARALAQIADCDWDHPGVLLLDEPTSALDIHHQLRLTERMHEWAARGLAVVVVLHDLELAARAADQLIVMRDGHVLAAGLPHEVLDSQCLAEGWAVHGRVALDRESVRLDVGLDRALVDER
ncbi:MAG: ATP-binding cassette domain-containing protein [Thioalkalivibrionaceae bacterium]